MATITNSLGQSIKTAAGNITTSLNGIAKDVSNIINSANIDINGLKSAVEGSMADLDGAIASKSSMIPTVAASLLAGAIKNRQINSLQPSLPFNNVLEKYASVNYIWTLSCLTVDEINRPDATYRLTGPKNIICRSGGSGSAKVKTATELGKGAVEFFIDDVEIETIVTHNKGTKQADAITGSFKIFEPYSMGLFYETLQVAALKCGHKNYIDAPMMLSLHFKGWDDFGNVSVAPGATRYFPIKVINSTFNVTEQGSTYDVAYIKYNDLSFGDQTQATKTDVNLSGNTVQELLQSGGKSLSTVLNTRLLKSKEAKQTNKVDQYIIMFPTQRSSASESLLGKPSESATGATTQSPKEGEVKDLSAERKLEIFKSIAGLGATNMPSEFESTISAQLGITIQRSAVSEAIRTFAENPINVNAIGKSKIVKSKNDSGTKPQPGPNVCTDKKTGLICRAQVQEPTTTRSFQFTSGTKVQDIIEEVIIASEWGRGIKERLNKPDQYNMVDWFKVESQVYETSDPKTVDATGANPKTFVYRIVPFKVNASRFASITKRTPNLAQLRTQAPKEYNYIYTGKNKDILDFDIQFDSAFFVGIGAQKGQASKDSKTASQSSKTVAEKEAVNKQNDGDTNPTSEGSPTVKEVIKNNSTTTGGGGQEWSETQVARKFNSALLDSPADLIKVDLKIWGDPYWLCDSGVGNYTAAETEFINLTKDGSMDYQSSEIDIVLNFRTPFDIGENGWMDFGGVSAPTKSFSGLYQCIGVKSSFNDGKFEQTLSLVRRRNQDQKTPVLTKEQIKQPKNQGLDGPEAGAIAASSGNALYTDGSPTNKIDAGS